MNVGASIMMMGKRKAQADVLPSGRGNMWCHIKVSNALDEILRHLYQISLSGRLNTQLQGGSNVVLSICSCKTLLSTMHSCSSFAVSASTFDCPSSDAWPNCLEAAGSQGSHSSGRNLLMLMSERLTTDSSELECLMMMGDESGSSPAKRRLRITHWCS